jgi:hypothetical protein
LADDAIVDAADAISASSKGGGKQALKMEYIFILNYEPDFVMMFRHPAAATSQIHFGGNIFPTTYLSTCETMTKLR